MERPQRPPTSDTKKTSIPRPSGLPTLRKPPQKPTTSAATPCRIDTGSKLSRENSHVTTGSANSAVGDPDRILTTDTDSFIIGDIVWVGGTKRGRIAFIGETQFNTQGEWAGVVLDEPVGKNDGSVQGVRYFQCEPFHGTFTRLTRLSRVSLLPFDPTRECEVHGSTPPRCYVERQRSASPSHYGGNTPSPGTGRTTPFRYTGSPTATLLKLGDRVIVQSATAGTRRGYLRYLGPTEFKEGEWAGVELDQPNGKNDGSVNGKRYFQCAPKHGIFAPPDKVSSSPANKHIASSIRRANSRESLASNISSVMSTASRSVSRNVRSALREMEVHLDKLIQEKEFDRQELVQLNSVIKHSEQAAEAALSKRSEELGSQVVKYKSEAEIFKQQNEALVARLDDMSRKFEDLQFLYEEEKILRNELQSQFEQSVGNQELESKLEAAQQNETSALVAGKESLLDDISKRYKHEIETLQSEQKKIESQLKKSETELSQLAKEKTKMEKHMAHINDELRNEFEIKLKAAEQKATQLLAEGEISLNENSDHFKSQIHVLETEKEQIQTKLNELETDLMKMTEEKNEMKKGLTNMNEGLREELEEMRRTLDKFNGKNEEMEKLAIAFRDLSTSKQELESKLQESQQNEAVLLAAKEASLNEMTKQAQSELQALQSEKERIEKELRESQSELLKLAEGKDKMQISLSNLNEQLRKDLELRVKEAEEKEAALIAGKEASLKENSEHSESQMQALQAEKEQLEAKLKGFETEIKAFIEEKTETEKVLTMNAQLKKDVDNLREKLEEQRMSNEAIKNLEVELSDLKITNQKLELNLLESHEKEATLQVEKESLWNENYENLKSQIQSLQAEKEQCESQLKISQSELIKLAAEKAEDERRWANLNENLNKEMGEVRLKLNQYPSNDTIETLEVALRDVTNAKGELEIKLKESENKLAALMVEKETSPNENIEQLKSEVLCLQAEKERISGQLKASELELVKVTKEKAQIQETLMKLNNEIAKELELKVNESQQKEALLIEKESLLNKNSEHFMSQIQLLETEKHQSQAHLKVLESELANLAKEKNEMQEALTAVNEHLREELELKLKEAEEKASALVAQNEVSLSKSSEHFKLQIQNLQAEKDRIGTQLTASETELAKAIEEKNKIREELTTFNEELRQELEFKIKEAQEKEAAMFAEKEASLKKDFEHLKSQMQALLAEKEQTENQLKASQSDLFDMAQQKNEMEKILTNSMDDLRKELDCVCTEREKMHQKNEELEHLRTTNQEINVVKHELELKLEEAQEKEKISSEANNALLNRNSEELRSQIHGLQVDKEQAEARLIAEEEKTAVIIKDLKLQYETFTSKIKRLTTEMESYVAEVNVERQRAMKLEEEKKVLFENEHKYVARIQELEALVKNVPKDKNAKGAGSGDNDSDQHIRFLNEVIVDLTFKKNELEQKVEILLAGGSLPDVNRNNVEQLGSSTVLVAPSRSYCDICETFDVHETEDCPTQCSDEPEANSKHHEARGIVRPFCRTCEVFGHSTENCDDGETF